LSKLTTESILQLLTYCRHPFNYIIITEAKKLWKVEDIKSQNSVVGDRLMVEEATSIAADASIKHSYNFSVNESIPKQNAINKLFHLKFGSWELVRRNSRIT
jgi:hypothetical protein